MAGTDPAQIVTEIFSLLGDKAAYSAMSRAHIRLFVGQTSRRAVVRNVSSTGLQIETDLPLHKGQQVLVKVLNGWSIMTRVAWVDGIRAGVSMDDPVDLISFEKTA
jgi:hypothetical protein